MGFERILRVSDGKRSPITSKAQLTTATLPWAGFDLEIALTESGVVGSFALEKPALFVCTRGGGTSEWTHNGVTKKQRIVSGTVCVATPFYEIERVRTAGIWEFCGVQLDVDKFRHHAPAHANAVGRLKSVFEYNDDSTISTLLMQLCAEARAGCPTGELYAESISLALLAYISTKYTTFDGSRDRSSLSAAQKRSVVDFIESNMCRQLAIVDIARHFGLSAAHFSRAFRSAFGVSPYRYVLLRRIERAKDLLAKTESSIGSVAAELGFSSHSHFTKAFHQSTRLTPQQFRSRR